MSLPSRSMLRVVGQWTSLCARPPRPVRVPDHACTPIAVVLALLALVLRTPVGTAADTNAVPNIFESPVPPVAECKIDQLVFTELARLKIQPVLCSDAVFVRRICLDVIGTLPTAQEARAFLQDTSPNKRRVLIERLLGCD